MNKYIKLYYGGVALLCVGVAVDAGLALALITAGVCVICHAAIVGSLLASK